MSAPRIIRVKGRPLEKSNPHVSNATSSHRPRHSLNANPIITLDLLIYVFSETLFHPFLSALLPLCLRSLAYPYESLPFILTTLFAASVSAYQIFAYFNRRLAFGWPRDVRWDKEVVVITGGKGGLGRVLVEILALRGVGVAVLDVAVEDGPAQGKGIEAALGDAVRWYKCDVGDKDQVERVWKQVVSDLGPPTILINNAGLSNPSTIFTQSIATVTNLFAANTISHFHLTQLYLRTLSSTHPKRHRAGGHIVTISSVLGHLGAANLSAYTASKAALTAYHSSLTAELGQSFPNIRTVLVAPGQLDTDLFRDVSIRGWLQRFTGPVVGAQELALAIVKLLDEGMGGEVRMPVYASLIPWLGVMPNAVRIGLRRWSGVDQVAAKGLLGMGFEDGNAGDADSEESENGSESLDDGSEELEGQDNKEDEDEGRVAENDKTK